MMSKIRALERTATVVAITANVNLTAQDAHSGTTSQVNCQLVDVPASGSTVGDSAQRRLPREPGSHDGRRRRGLHLQRACTAVTNCTPGSATDTPVATLPDPIPQPKAQFSGAFNSGRPVGYLNGSSIPDILLPSALENMYSTADGAAFLFNGDLNAGGGGEASWHFGTLTDPTPHIGGNFGGSFTGVGNLTDFPGALNDDVPIASDSPFDPNTPPVSFLASRRSCATP